MRVQVVTGALAAAFSALTLYASLAPQPTATPAEEVMWRKLDLAHDVLDAIALDDFEALAAYADDLGELGEAGEWLEAESADYRSESEQFRRAAKALGDAARDRDSETAALAYVDLTLRCLRCHRVLGASPR